MAEKRIEIEVRGIDEQGEVTETFKVTMEDGSLPERAMILAENERRTVLTMVNCDRVDACQMVRHNDKARQIAGVTTIGEMLFGALMKDGNDEEAEDNGELGESQGEEPEDL